MCSKAAHPAALAQNRPKNTDIAPVEGQGDVAYMRMWRDILSSVLLASLLAGCGSRTPAKPLYERLQSGQESEVAQAAVDAGQAGDRRAVPYLIEALQHDAADVRLFAIASLRKITGQDFGYRPWAPVPQRDAAVERWRLWWSGPSATALSARESE